MRKITNIVIFAVGILTCLLTLWFVVGFDQKKTDRINELARLSKTRSLTPEEKEARKLERQRLKKEKLEMFK